MIAPRRFLPSTSALIAFEAAARLGTATAAGAELSLSQSAISRQIKTLEEQLDVQLMRREGRLLYLTPVGKDYADKVRTILSQLASASVHARANPEGGTLNLAILPAFGMHWLAPRLSDFAATHPEITVNLSTRLSPFDFRTTRFDAAIHFGRTDWVGAFHMALMSETVVPVCAPEMLPEPAQNAKDILDHPLLHLDTRPRGWARWFKDHGVTQDVPPGMIFDQFSTMAQAAMHGLGVALLPTFVAEPYLNNRQLARAARHTNDSIGTYYLVWPQDRTEGAPLKAFRSWLGTQTG
ncbi:MAG: LysR substrate-binding domain-containing protein [Ascidiaceihabitans sp.]|nr:LysR substrate-binding domain-containing protein [Ascidiaceihabitans sp.]